MIDDKLRDILENSISQELSGTFWGIFGGIPKWRQRSLMQDLASIVVRDTRDLLNEIRAEAWDEGYNAGEEDVFMHEDLKDWDAECVRNPYRPTEK